MNSDEILNRIKSIRKDSNILKPERIFYSGPNYSEEAIYYGDRTRYEDLIDFWISILSWISMDLIEFDDITIFNEMQEYPPKMNHCKEINLESHKLSDMMNKIKSLEQFSEGMTIIRCFKMSQEWDDKKYMFDCGSSFFLFNWYTGE